MADSLVLYLSYANIHDPPPNKKKINEGEYWIRTCFLTYSCLISDYYCVTFTVNGYLKEMFVFCEQLLKPLSYVFLGTKLFFTVLK